MYSATKSRTVLSVIFTLFVAICAGIFFCAGAGDAHGAEAAGTLNGAGTELNPYIISDAEDLAIMADLVNNGSDSTYRVSHYSLTASINLDELATSELKFAPIGTSTRPFTGQFNGNGNIIYNLRITENSSVAPLANDKYVGLFGYVGTGGTIEDTGISNANYGKGTSQYVGGLVGYNVGTVRQCFFEGSLTASDTVGGIVGYNAGTVTRCFANGYVYAGTNNAKAGGLIGVNDSKGSLSYSYAQCAVSVSVQNAYNVGGIIGNQLSSTAHSYCYYNSSVNPSLKALGASSPSVSAPADTSTFKGMTSQQLDSAALTELFGQGTASYWVRKYQLNDHTGYTGPLLQVFDAEDADDNALSAAVTVRMFGIDRASQAVWGSAENPYLISNAQQLDNLATAVNEYSESYTGGYFRLTSDVTVSADFSGIGIYAGNSSQNRPFGGVFDGANRTIRGLDISSDSGRNNYLGFFGYTVAGAEIRNLTIAADCVVSGGNYIGSLIGYAANTVVANIASYATVEAQYGNSGGIVGYDERGSYDSVLSAVTLVAPDNVSTMYGFVGNGRTVNSVSNVWYLAPDKIGNKVNRFLTSNNLGAVLRVDTACGTVTASKDSSGTVSFVASPSSGWQTEYRLSTEEVLAHGNSFVAPASGAYNANIVYARFVKEISAVPTGVATLVFRETGSASGYYYIGQTYRLVVTVPDRYYLKSISGGSEAGAYSYESQSSSVLYTDTVQGSTSVLNAETAAIAYDGSHFPSVHTYNAQPVTFDVSWLSGVPAGFSTEVVYSGGSAPVNASANGVSYTFLIVYYNEYNVRVGSRSVSFTIARAPLGISDVSGLTVTKQWDNSDLAESVAVDAAIVSGIYPGDEVSVMADMQFSTKDITGSAKADVTYTFELSGRAASNYTAPSSVTLNGVGEITKRDVYFKPVSLTGIYSATQPVFSEWNVINDVVGAQVNPSFKFEKVVPDGSGGYIADTDYSKGDVGIYKVTISSVSGDTEHYVPHIYGAEKDADGNEYVIYTVVPREVSVSYTVDGKPAASAALVYSDSAFTVGAQFTDALGKSVSVTRYLKIYLDGEAAYEVKNAGAYAVCVENFDNKNYSIVNASQEFVVEKADQQAISVVLLKDDEAVAEASFTDNLSFAVDGGTLVDSEKTFELVTGDGLTTAGEIDADGVFRALQAGTFRVRATLKGNENYNDVHDEISFTVLKSELKVSFAEEVTVDYLDEVSFRFAYEGLRESDTEPAGLSGLTVLVEGVAFDPQKAYDKGEYKLTLDVSKATADGYTFALAESAVSKLTVKRRAVEIRAKNASSVYGEPDAAIEFEIMNDDEVTVDMLAGSLSREAGSSVGKYAVTLGTLGEANPNFSIFLYGGEGAGVYEITKAALTVRITPQSKYYGEPDPAVKYVVEGLAYDDTEESIGLIDVATVVDRVQGEDAAIGDVIGISYEYVLKQGAVITHDSDKSKNYEAEVAFEKAALTILPAVPATADKPLVKLDAKCSLSATDAPQANFTGVGGVALDGTYAWKNAAEIPDFTDSATVECIAVFIPVDLNYATTEYTVRVSVIPKQVTVTFTGSTKTTYTGEMQPDVQFTVNGADEGDELGVSVTYSGDRINAGSFKATVSIANKNYVISGNATRTVTIEKAVLNVALTESEITVLEGESVDYEIYYFGFVGSDDESVLKSLATVDIPTEPGVYDISPEGVSAANYTVKYGVSVLRVNREFIYSENSDVIFEGSFSPSLKVSVSVAENNANGIDAKFSEMKAAYKDLADKTLSEVFKLEYTDDGEAYANGDKVKISMMLDEKYEDTSKLAFVVMTYDGEMVYVRDVTYLDGRAVLEVENAEYIAVSYATGEESNILLYAGIGAGAAVVLIIVIAIVVKLKRKRDARFIKYRDDIED